MLNLSSEVMLALAGTLLGITFGIVGGISKEEKVRYTAISAFGAIIVAFMGISFIGYGYTLEALFSFLIWSCIGFIMTFIIGLGYRRWRDRPFIGFFPNPLGPTSREMKDIMRNAPNIEAKHRIVGNFLFGFKIEIALKIKNISQTILDDLHLSLKISDLLLKKKEKTKFKDLPNIVQNEEREFMITERIGRFGKYAIDMKIIRNRVLLQEFHWTMKQQSD